ncbi:MAG: hypothetical protein IJO48_02305, partial [Clostridia bacterium]|nr:hypothetical protein [Clostridia bacterium]
MKRIISVLIVAIMLMSMSCSAAGALLNNYSCNYVCLGDSVSNGYGLDGYLRPDGTNVRGYKQIVKCAYHYIVPQALNANIEQLGYSGLRAEDMLYLLDAEYESDEYTQRYFIETGRFEVTGGLEKMRKEYEEAVKNADIISINLGSNNFGTYFQEQIA